MRLHKRSLFLAGFVCIAPGLSLWADRQLKLERSRGHRRQVG
ncbi:hypothetical protein QUB80_20675 [Chlorogloeopsis sp. ULAP01]|nr:hypothetical protein [Chlorogloeopsis sp. ULAP01]MDM9383114.1 hypothetical protein [Chlorogloeopsis sp. ULAP01]